MGGRRVNHGSKFRPKKCAERYRSDDYISRLPDDILIAILSALPLKEAGRTSVLSSRWRNSWRHTSVLNFDAHSAMEKIAQKLGLRRGERRKYVKWVNSVLQSHRGLTLKEFRICFTLVRSTKRAITNWLEYAFERQVQRLELNLFDGDWYQDKTYVFPEELFCKSSHPHTALSNYKALKALCFRAVEVTGEAIEFFLRNCPLLEQLTVQDSVKLSSLEVCGSSLVLKQLELCDCRALTSLKVSAPNLTSLTLTKIQGLVLEDVPMLTNVYINCAMDSYIYIRRLVPTLSCCLSQLEILTLDVRIRKDLFAMFKFPEMPRLKKLVIMEFLSDVDESLLGLASFIGSSPYLQEFVLEQSWSECERTNKQVEKVVMPFPHQHLNVVKFLGYYGCTSDVELVGYLVENCAALEEIIIDPRDQCIWSYEPVYPEQLEKEQASRTYAKQQLEPLVPKHIRLVIC